MLAKLSVVLNFCIYIWIFTSYMAIVILYNLGKWRVVSTFRRGLHSPVYFLPALLPPSVIFIIIFFPAGRYAHPHTQRSMHTHEHADEYTRVHTQTHTPAVACMSCTTPRITNKWSMARWRPPRDMWRMIDGTCNTEVLRVNGASEKHDLRAVSCGQVIVSSACCLNANPDYTALKRRHR